MVGTPVGKVVGAAVVAADVATGPEMIEVAITPLENGLESPRSLAHADATRSVAIASARLTARP
jgi:hypothetical protein